MKICTIIGARPQFIKAAAISRAIAAHNSLMPNTSRITEVIIHTGQHYDNDMSAIFFSELEIPEPKYNLNIGSGSHGLQTGRMLTGIEDILIKEKPDWVLIYGDTNSTLAGALAAGKLHIRIAHVEAGLRSFNRLMPEEINRVVADQLSNSLFCPSDIAVENLRNEGITKGVLITGDVMYDALQFAVSKTKKPSKIFDSLNLQPKNYLLATVHRAENTDDPKRLINIMNALSKLAESEVIVLPLHPRTKKILEKSFFITKTPSTINPEHRTLNFEHSSLKIIDPVGYFDMIALEKSARMILTDSGGIQKEAYWLKVPCITLRDETEWVETVEGGWNILTGADKQKIINTVQYFKTPTEHPALYSDGYALDKIINTLLERNLLQHD
jgi:UDP-N-acetylglucosamine 2-epimerase